MTIIPFSEGFVIVVIAVILMVVGYAYGRLDG